jgi:type IV pilus assembly protein PilA
MTLLKAYLSTPHARRALSKKPGEQGFSLIELVVVVAVLAILSAVAIPSFTSINAKARASAATNTLATIAKECAVKYANGETAPTFPTVSLDGYTSIALAGSATNCAITGNLVATSTTPATLPTFTYAVATGVKTCSYTSTAGTAAADALKLGCKALSGTNGIW